MLQAVATDSVTRSHPAACTAFMLHGLGARPVTRLEGQSPGYLKSRYWYTSSASDGT